MKQTRVDGVGSHSQAIQRGWVRPAGTNVESSAPVDLEADGDLLEGDVVVLQADGTVAKTTTVADGRPTGVCTDDIDDGESGPVAFWGPVDLINVTGSVTAGSWGRTSASAGNAEEVGAPSTAFVYFTSSGTTPEGFLIGAGLGGSGGGGGADPPVDHGDAGPTETIDADAGTWHVFTLTEDTTITITGFTVDIGLVMVVKVIQDSTGGWAITWDPDVQFIGDDQPDQSADTVTWFLLWTDEGDSNIYATRVGGSAVGAASDLTSMWVPVMVEDPSSGNWFVTVTGDGDAVMTEVPL